MPQTNNEALVEMKNDLTTVKQQLADMQARMSVLESGLQDNRHHTLAVEEDAKAEAASAHAFQGEVRELFRTTLTILEQLTATLDGVYKTGMDTHRMTKSILGKLESRE
jgi:uncharacterized protein YPO0396